MKKTSFKPALLGSLCAIGLTLSGCASVLTGENTATLTDNYVALTNTSSTMMTTTMQATAPVMARDTSLLVDNYPDRHVVVKGDTLWDISAKFLRDPWLWPQVWDHNQQIKNPHLIYPGDIITLRWCDGKPCFGFGEGSRRLQPQIRYEDLGTAIPTIPYDAVAGFLSRPTVLDAEYAKSLPYVLASADGRLIMSQGNKVYARGNLGTGINYNIFNIGEPYVDPETGFVYGLEALHVGEGEVTKIGDPATMKIRKSRREVSRGDRMLPFDHERDIQLNFTPKAAQVGTTGVIMSVVEGVEYVGQYDVVVINRGRNSGITRGDVVSVYQKGEQIWDPYDQSKITKQDMNWFERNFGGPSSRGGDYVKLPDESAGVAMIFRVYDNISYAVVMHATREIKQGDLIRSPNDTTNYVN